MAIVNGFITDGIKSVNFSADASCIGGVPEGSIAGTINNIFTGGPVLEDFTFASATPLLVGINEALDSIHVVYDNVTVTNITTEEVFTGGTAILTTNGVSSTAWEGSITILFDTSILTFFGRFTGSTIEDATVICQLLL
ncbi:hypothetical protein [Phosphitispora fastidiosa]|uniref:hypothetical protein n=1 Tax=Phosphitispora fastidiosa TaxID=2837202 RepID=UPI001E3D43C9|nr:hypothetical protein [Phosphitispora fastidiosa]MBU7008574.1 hypothetical protein [Phosphitispora fastidiosa]